MDGGWISTILTLSLRGGLILVKFLNEYAEIGEKYVEVLEQIIKQNNLQDFDDAKLLPSSIELESLI